MTGMHNVQNYTMNVVPVHDDKTCAINMTKACYHEWDHSCKQ